MFTNYCVLFAWPLETKSFAASSFFCRRAHIAQEIQEVMWNTLKSSNKSLTHWPIFCARMLRWTVFASGLLHRLSNFVWNLCFTDRFFEACFNSQLRRHFLSWKICSRNKDIKAPYGTICWCSGGSEEKGFLINCNNAQLCRWLSMPLNGWTAWVPVVLQDKQWCVCSSWTEVQMNFLLHSIAFYCILHGSWRFLGGLIKW